MSLSQTVEGFLNERHVAYTTHHHRPSKSSLDSAHSAHIDEDCLAKSVVLGDEKGFVLAVLPASRRLEVERLRDELGRSLHVCEEREAVRLFPDCEVGALPPLGSAYGLPTVIDTSLEGREEVFFEGGDHETLVRLDGDAFLDLLDDASVAEIASEFPSLGPALVARERLHDALHAVRRALAAPIGNESRWRARLESTLASLSAAIEDHVVETESVGGLLREVVDQAPRLWREVDALRREHAALSDACMLLREAFDEGDSSRSIRRRTHALVGRVEEHRHRGADVVYEAFGVDIGGG